uniref:Uncharacterized protein n=1 Tax=Cacopsylla melanoneura TaxID=428564 RepID=A0A8D8XXF2_9HEMI
MFLLLASPRYSSKASHSLTHIIPLSSVLILKKFMMFLSKVNEHLATSDEVLANRCVKLDEIAVTYSHLIRKLLKCLIPMTVEYLIDHSLTLNDSLINSSLILKLMSDRVKVNHSIRSNIVFKAVSL